MGTSSNDVKLLDTKVISGSTKSFKTVSSDALQFSGSFDEKSSVTTQRSKGWKAEVVTAPLEIEVIGDAKTQTKVEEEKSLLSKKQLIDKENENIKKSQKKRGKLIKEYSVTTETEDIDEE